MRLGGLDACIDARRRVWYLAAAQQQIGNTATCRDPMHQRDCCLGLVAVWPTISGLVVVDGALTVTGPVDFGPC
jgi:hypothetical protein